MTMRGIRRWYAQSSLKDKTAWDWLDLLIVPLMLALLTLLFSLGQFYLEGRREDRRAQAAQDVATDNQREQALQIYFDDMTDLLIGNGRLRTSTAGSEERSVARTRTLAVLRGLDGRRKGQLLQFLHESQLIASTAPIISLEGADLEDINLDGANLTNANLAGTYLRDANLNESNLEGANFTGANLEGAYLHKTNLKNAIFTEEQFNQVRKPLEEVVMPDGSIHP